MAEKTKNTEGARKKRDRVGTLLYTFYFITLICSVVLFCVLIGIQLFFHPDPELASKLRPRTRCEKVDAARGNILSQDGRMLAMTFPVYEVSVDCTVPADTLWDKNVSELSNGLAKILKDKTSKQYRAILDKGRSSKDRYLTLAKQVDLNTLEEIRRLPIFEKGRFSGGLVTKKSNKRQYPYGDMASRTIGFIRDSKSGVKNTHVGLEGKFDYILHGTDGEIWLKETDQGMVQNFDSAYVKPQDGNDVRTTLNIDYQTIVDKELRAALDEVEGLEAGCCVLMETKTGAIRAMSNLMRNPKDGGKMEEIYNLAIGRLGEPGSVFKATCMMIMLENGYVKSLSQTIPGSNGVMSVPGHTYKVDDHIMQYERAHGTKEIPLLYAFQVSSNYAFQYLAWTNFQNDPAKYVGYLHMFHLGEAFDFDLNGMAKPTLPSFPEASTIKKNNRSSWASSLTGVATGYAASETPMHILTFYNSIANKGKMMKPYLVEDIEKNGIVVEKRGPSILNSSVCSKSTADTLTRAMVAVTQKGTARLRLKDAKCTVAGKTGTSQAALESGGYIDKEGRKKNQGTFVGFFPAEDPQYTIICTVYSYLSHESFYGGTIPAQVVRNVVDQVYDIDPYWQSSLSKEAELQAMPSPVSDSDIQKGATVTVPSLSGLGIKDAIYLLENSGLRCSYSGVGHIESQEPAAGTKVKNGTTVKVTLK